MSGPADVTPPRAVDQVSASLSHDDDVAFAVAIAHCREESSGGEGSG